jgi:hypothetical protein
VRQLQTQLETVLTRGLRLRMETGVSVFVSAEDALIWSACNGFSRRQIGFRASVQSPATHSEAVEDVELVGHPVPAISGVRAK